jgi:hypothetical protein
MVSNLYFGFRSILNILAMMNDNDMCLFEFVGEVEKDRRTNLIFNVLAINVIVATNLSNVENVHL